MPQTTERPPSSQIPNPVAQPTPTLTIPPRPKRRPGLKKWLIAAGILLIIAGALTPLATKWGINYLLKTRFSSTIALQQLRVNPFTGKLELSATQNNQPILDRNQMEWDWLPFLRRTVRLNDIQLKNLTVEVQRFPDGSVKIGDIRLDDMWKDLSQMIGSIAWAFPIRAEVRNVLLENVKVKFTDPQVQATLVFHQIHLQPAGSPDNAFVRLGVLRNLTSQLDFTGTIRVSGLQVDLPQKSPPVASKKPTTIEKLQGVGAEFSGLAQFSDLHVELQPGPEPGRWMPVFRVASMAVTDNAVFRLQGKGFRTPLKVTFQPLKLEMKNLDSEKPGEETSLTLETAAGGRSKIRYAFTGRPLEKPLSLRGGGKITHFDMPPLSPLVERFVGYRVKAGQLNLDAKDSVKRGKLDSKWALLLNRFELQKLNAAELDPLTDQLDVPLDTGLAMLKDKNGDVNLELPLKADLNDPDHALSSVITGAMSAGITAGVSASVSKILPPVSSGAAE